ncbi:UPAR/Ly6 domain-containing protein crim [Panulirus ornatus]|uniref:UPAR/Ly6 domain-containing protein crim n=1 Tax=Panulirus ornatus TaxID=150431 RepID=UPI003A8AD602
MKNLLLLVSFSALVSTASSIWCYQCVGSHPGCGLYDFDWRYYWSYSCPDPYDKCVKIIEQKGVDVMVTRDCLSNLEGHRRDIPADRYEGCRPAAKDPLVGQYIFPSVPEIDHKRLVVLLYSIIG